MTGLAVGENNWGDLAPLFSVGVLTGLSPWLFALKGLPWFPKLPPGTADGGEPTGRLLFTAAASICSGWVYIIFASLPPIRLLAVHRGMMALATSFVSLLAYVAIWLWLSSIEAAAGSTAQPGTIVPWTKGRSICFIIAFGFYILTFTSLAISVSVATLFQDNYLIEGIVLDANNTADVRPKPVPSAMVTAQAHGEDIDETATDGSGGFLLVVPRKGLESPAIKVFVMKQKNGVPGGTQETRNVWLRGWNKLNIIFNRPPEGSPSEIQHPPPENSSPSKGPNQT